MTNRQHNGQKKKEVINIRTAKMNRQHNGQKKKEVINIRTAKKNRQHNGQKKKEIINIRTAKKDRQHNGQKKKEVINIRTAKKNRQHNGQKKKDDMTNIDLQNTTQKTKDRVLRTSLKTWGELRCSGRVSNSCSTSGTSRIYIFAMIY